jgi:hypothetical protein
LTPGGISTARIWILSTVPDSDPNDITRTHVTLTSGTMVTHYRIIEKIGSGGKDHVRARVSSVLQASFTRFLANLKIGDLV